MLAIPAIGLRAPVVQGLTNAVLSVAVGHDPLTVWPGGPGESVLLAHDVSYFSALDRLQPGDSVIWTFGCERAVYSVVGTTITQPGALVPLPLSGSGLALITCWPTNALFWTSQRYMVETELVSTQALAKASSAPAPALVQLTVPAPPALVALGLSFVQAGVHLGRLVISGSPDVSFTEGPEPLVVVNAALEDYVAAEKTAAAGNQSWWKALALAQVPLPAAWTLAHPTNVTLVVSGSTVQGVVLSSSAKTVTLTVRAGVLLVTGVGPGG